MAPDFPRGAAEVEALVGEGLPVSPQIKGALKSLPGVVTVEEV
jgi:DNA polymerase-3 subunit alpha